MMKSPFRAEIVIASALFLFALPGWTVERDQMLSHAPDYEDHGWTCQETNTTGTDCPDWYLSDFEPGSYIGLPYDWGGFVTVDEFDEDLADGLGAGSHSDDGVLACTTGLDCSGYVSVLWELPYKYGTSTLPEISGEIDIRDMYPGDIFNLAGSHVIMWVGKDEEGDAVITESSGTCNGVCRRSVAWSYLSSYTPRVSDVEYVQTATVGDFLGTIGDTVPVDSFPFRDWRNTRYASSDVFDTYSEAPDLDESGPEFIYELALDSPGSFYASVLDAPQADVDLHLLGSLDAEDCLARAHTELTYEILEPGTYYLTVDSYVGSDATEYAGAYVLDVDFEPAGMDGDADGDTDGDTDGDSASDSDTEDECTCGETGSVTERNCACGVVGDGGVRRMGILQLMFGGW